MRLIEAEFPKNASIGEDLQVRIRLEVLKDVTPGRPIGFKLCDGTGEASVAPAEPILLEGPAGPREWTIPLTLSHRLCLAPGAYRLCLDIPGTAPINALTGSLGEISLEPGDRTEKRVRLEERRQAPGRFADPYGQAHPWQLADGRLVLDGQGVVRAIWLGYQAGVETEMERYVGMVLEEGDK